MRLVKHSLLGPKHQFNLQSEDTLSGPRQIFSQARLRVIGSSSSWVRGQGKGVRGRGRRDGGWGIRGKYDICESPHKDRSTSVCPTVDRNNRTSDYICLCVSDCVCISMCVSETRGVSVRPTQPSGFPFRLPGVLLVNSPTVRACDWWGRGF